MKNISHVYLINLDRRTDRMEKCEQRLMEVGIEYERFSAIDGSTLDIVLPEQTPEKRWNKAAFALCMTTIKILEDAEQKGYDNILILEDDIVLNPLFESYIDAYMNELNDVMYDFAFLGYTIPGMTGTSPFSYRWDRVYNMVSCHAYIVNKNIIKAYKKLLSNLDNPIDYYVNLIVGGRLNSLCAVSLGRDKLIWQESGISDIEGGYYDTSFTN